jgi:hypothetical protein
MRFSAGPHSLPCSSRCCRVAWRVRRNLCTLLFFIGVIVVAQSARAEWETTTFGSRQDFEPLLADPKEPRFFASVQQLDGGKPLNRFQAGVVGLGGNFELVRWREQDSGEAWQLGLTSGICALFKLRDQASDLVNSDYLAGISVSHRNGSRSYRARLTHQSSHLGDEFLIKSDIERINYSFEELDLTASQFWGDWRAYGGGGYIVRSKPRDIDRTSLVAGGEYHGSKTLWGHSRFAAGIHADLQQQHSWRPNLHVVLGLMFGNPRKSDRQIGVQLEAYDGYSPWGQFYDVKIRSYGSTITFRF